MFAVIPSDVSLTFNPGLSVAACSREPEPRHLPKQTFHQM